MNKHRKIVSHKNNKKKYRMRRTLKASHMFKKRTNKTLTLNNKFRKRNQIGCSRKNNMSGGGVSMFQPITDMFTGVTHLGSSIVGTFSGTQIPPSPAPEQQYT
jgi:hypothetical protein